MVDLEIDFKIAKEEAETLIAKVSHLGHSEISNGKFLKSIYDPCSGYYILDVRGRLVWSCVVETTDRIVDVYNAFVSATLFSDSSTKNLQIYSDDSSASFTVDVSSPGGRLISSGVEMF